MKKLAIIIAIFSTILGNSSFAQEGGKQIGQAAQAGSYSSFNNFAWGIGLGGLAVLGIMAGVVAGTASQSTSTSGGNSSSFSH